MNVLDLVLQGAAASQYRYRGQLHAGKIIIWYSDSRVEINKLSVALRSKIRTPGPEGLRDRDEGKEYWPTRREGRYKPGQGFFPRSGKTRWKGMETVQGDNESRELGYLRIIRAYQSWYWWDERPCPLRLVQEVKVRRVGGDHARGLDRPGSI